MSRYPTPKIRNSAVFCWSSCEEIPAIQSKRNPSKTVGAERGHQRTDRLWNHNHRKLANLITWTTVLSNSKKLSHACMGPPKTDGSWWRGLTKCGPLEKGMANHFSIFALRTPWTVWKGKKNGILKDELPRSVGAQYATGDQWSNSRKNEGMEKSKNNTQLWMWLVIGARSDAVKRNIS